MTLVDQFTHGGFDIEILADPSPDSPRGWSTLARLVMRPFSRYSLGDETVDPSEYEGGWAAYVRDEAPGGLAYPVTVQHLGEDLDLTLAGTYETCDGVAIITRETLVAEYGPDNRGPWLASARAAVEAELEAYSQYLNGDVFGYRVTDPSGKLIDDLWGLYGHDYAISEAEAVVEATVAERTSKHAIACLAGI